MAACAALLCAPLAALAGLRFGFDPVEREARAPLIHRRDGFVGSSACRACHASHYESWARTFHRTMTQRADPETVLGVFDGRAVSYAGRTARPISRGDRRVIELPLEAGGTREAEVALAVGSRRYQQYFEREERADGCVYRRLPILWHIGAQRWLHLNTVFLHPDSPDWDEHRSTWNENCIFCHNTGPEPHRSRVGAFDSKVGELGIACEACHGPGQHHASAHRDPFRRYLGYLAGGPDPFIVHPGRLDPARSVSVCGQCHGQRLPRSPESGEAWLTTGPTFRSGDELTDHVRPVSAGTPVPSGVDPDLFHARFWADGTPRLTAYEYQGVTASACYRRGGMTCESCHAMHAGDVHGQIEPGLRGDAACTQCHAEIGRDVSAHTHHAAAGSGSRCLECHMPRIVYGITEIHRSHRIASPDPAREAEQGKPGACTLCHLDRSPAWAARETARLWGVPADPPRERADGAGLDLPDSVASLLAGDPVQRAVYARAIGRRDAAVDPRDKGFLRMHLGVTLGDAYPSVRWLAQRSLSELETELPLGIGEALDAFDFTAGPDVRRDAVFACLHRIAERAAVSLHPPGPGLLLETDFTPDFDAIVRLTERQGSRGISIGE